MADQLPNADAVNADRTGHPSPAIIVDGVIPASAFDNRFVRELPGDPVSDRRPRQVTGAAWSSVSPTPVPAPRLLSWSPEAAALLDLDADAMTSPAMASVLGGNALYEGMSPYAGNYGGHQFGYWAGQLGDGRAINLGEVVNRRGKRWEMQLKGAGLTPYSRHADGRAVLRSSVREFLCSEAMHHLGVPTTRALSLVGTGDDIVRDMFYDGHPRAEPGAIVCRLAPSFIRLGHFELPSARGEHDLLERLIEFTIDRDFPELTGDRETRRGDWFMQVCERTGVLIAHWQRVGFVHGVMNTDNLSILGLTIDYGPYGWLDNFDPDWTPNTTDAERGRYRFGQQPAVAYWNLSRLAGALAPVFSDHDVLRAGLARYQQAFTDADQAFSATKLGLLQFGPEEQALWQDGLALMTRAEIDMTLWFRGLADIDPAAPSLAPLEHAFYDPAARARFDAELRDWLIRYGSRLARQDEPAERRRARMQAVNPRYVLRNYLSQQAIDRAEQGDPSGIDELLAVMRRPYDEQPGNARFAQKRPDWARQRAGCSQLSCSS